MALASVGVWVCACRSVAHSDCFALIALFSSIQARSPRFPDILRMSRSCHSLLSQFRRFHSLICRSFGVSVLVVRSLGRSTFGSLGPLAPCRLPTAAMDPVVRMRTWTMSSSRTTSTRGRTGRAVDRLLGGRGDVCHQQSFGGRS